MAANHTNPYYIHKPDNTILKWRAIHENPNYTHKGYHAVMGQDKFFRCYFYDDNKGCIYDCICNVKPGQNLVNGDQVECRVEPRGGVKNLCYAYLPTQLVPLHNEMVMWSTDSSRGVVDTQTESEKIRRAQRQWKDVTEGGGVSRRAMWATLQKGGFFRCHYLENNCLYTCIFEQKPNAAVNVGRVEPVDGLDCIEYDSLAPISLTSSNINVVWDTSRNELTDKGELEKIRLKFMLEYDKKIAEMKKQDPHFGKRRQHVAETNRRLAHVGDPLPRERRAVGAAPEARVRDAT